MITITKKKQLDSNYLNKVLYACQRKQYERVEKMLSNVINDTIDNNILDPRLLSIIYSLAQFYTLEGNRKRAIELYQLLIHLKQTVTCLDCSDDYKFEQIAIRQLNEDENYKKLFPIHDPANKPSFLKLICSAFHFDKKYKPC